MFSSLLSIVDSVLTLDEGCSRNDILSGDQVVIDGNLNKSVSGRISGAASLVCIRGADKRKKFYVIVGKHKLELQGSMDMNPKPLSMVCPTHKSVRVTNDQNKYFEIRFNDAISFGTWLPALGEALAESICSEVLVSQEASNRIVCSNMRRCIHTCELLTSPSKAYIRRVNEIYSIRRKLLEVMSTLRSNPCDVNMKDLRSLKELCLKYPELRTDPDMSFLLERMPSDRYSSEDLQVILKDVLYAESDDAGVVRAQVYHGGSANGNMDDAGAPVASAIMAHETGRTQSPMLMHAQAQRSERVLQAETSVEASYSVPSESTKAVVPVHKKSRIVLNGVEIQSSARSPSSAGKALSKQIKIKSKFTTPSQRKESVRPKSKSKTPPPSINILSEIKYNVTPPAVLGLFDSPVPEATQRENISPLPSAPVDKENVPSVNKNVTPAPRRSVVKATPVASLIPVRTKSPTPGAPTVVEENCCDIDAGNEPGDAPAMEERPFPAINICAASAKSECQQPEGQHKFQEVTIDLIPEVLEQQQSLFGSPVKSTTNVPFFSPPRTSSSLIADVSSLFEDAVVFAVSVQEPKLAAAQKVPTESPAVTVSQTMKDKKTGEKKRALSQPRSSLIPAYEVPVSKVISLSTNLTAKPSKLPVAVDRCAPVPTVEPVMSSEAVVDATLSEKGFGEKPPIVFDADVVVEVAPALEPALPLACPTLVTPICVRRSQPIAITETQPSAVRESRGKKSTSAQSLMSPTAKPLRAKHFTPSRETVGLSVTAPRTPAQASVMVHSSTATQEKTPANSPVKTNHKTASQSPKITRGAEKTQVAVKDAPLGQDWAPLRRNFLFAALAFLTVICAILVSREALGPSPVPLLPLHVPVVQVAAEEVVTIPTSSATSSESLAVQVDPLGQEAVVSDAAPLPKTTSGFEMHVRFEGDTSTPLTALVSPQQKLSSNQREQQTHALQRHSSSALHAHLRKLQRLLSLPVKVLRSLFDKALQKFERIRKVLAE